MICAACNVEITECPNCGGMVCTPGCPDRDEDGCTCDTMEETDMDGDGMEGDETDDEEIDEDEEDDDEDDDDEKA